MRNHDASAGPPLIGALLALASAATLGFNTAVVRRLMMRGSPFALLIVSIVVAAPVFALLAVVTGEWQRAGQLTGAAYAWLAAAGVLNFIGGRYSNWKAIQSMGANLTAPVRTLNVLFSVVLGVTLLHEEVDLLRGTGIALLIIAPLVAFSRPSAMGRELRSGTTLRLAQGIFWGLVSAASYGAASFLIRWVLAGTALSMLGATVAHAAAAVILLATLGLEHNRRDLAALDRAAQKAFAVVTANMILAQVFRFAALEAAPVSVVAPLVEVQAFFGIGFAYLMNRRTESFSPLVILGTVLAVIGAAAITA